MHKGVQRVLRMRHYCISRDVMQQLETCATSNAPLLGGDTHVPSPSIEITTNFNPSIEIITNAAIAKIVAIVISLHTRARQL